MSSSSAAARWRSAGIAGLLAAGAEVEVVAPQVTPGVEGMAPELRWTARPYRDGDLDGAWYALACTDDPAVNAAVAAEAERHRIFCVRADDAPAGSAVTPAVGRTTASPSASSRAAALAARPLCGPRWSRRSPVASSTTPPSRCGRGSRSSAAGPATPS